MIVAALALGFAPMALAAEYPSKPIRMIYPWPAGSGGDIAARLLADHVGKFFKVPVKVSNVEGGAGTIGTAELVKSKPDGYTIGVIPIGPAVTQPTFNKKLPYKTEDMDPVCMFTFMPTVLVAGMQTPYSTFQEFVAYGKANSGKITMANSGAGSVPTILITNVGEVNGFNMISVPFKGLGPSVTAIVGGHVDVSTAFLAGVIKFSQAGKLKILATFLPNRIEAIPDVPSVEEFGIKDNPFVWSGVFTPKNLDPDVKKRIAEAFAKAVNSEDFKKAMAKAELLVNYQDAATFAGHIKKDQKIFGAFIQ